MPVIPTTPGCTFDYENLRLVTTAYGFDGDYAQTDPDGGFPIVQFNNFQSGSVYSLDSAGQLTIRDLEGVLEFANVPTGRTNTALQFNRAGDTGTISTCAFANGILTCVTGPNTILYVCTGESALMTGPALPAPDYTTIPPHICAIATFRVESPDDGSPVACTA